MNDGSRKGRRKRLQLESAARQWAVHMFNGIITGVPYDKCTREKTIFAL